MSWREFAKYYYLLKDNNEEIRKIVDQANQAKFGSQDMWDPLKNFLEKTYSLHILENDGGFEEVSFEDNDWLVFILQNVDLFKS